mmetsp:Transcript_30821/g.50985  ORF Transcript_30821/g.50985 Transcript_30821/m.50985 type:complete len:528 (+) Transcript_30821:25-1608(+)
MQMPVPKEECGPDLSWPSIDLLVRAYQWDVALFPTLFQSMQLFWPRGVGKVKVIVSEDEFADLYPIIKKSWEDAQLAAERLLQRHCGGMTKALRVSVVSEAVPSALRHVGYYAKQYSTLLFDRHSSATFVAIMDVDTILQAPVSPWHVFSDGRPYLIGSNIDAIKFAQSTSWLIGDLPQFDFMMQVPVVVRRELLDQFRRWVVKRHKSVVGSQWDPNSFLSVFTRTYVTSVTNHTLANTPCNFCLLGNWAYHVRRHNSFAFIIEGCERNGQHAVVRFARHSTVIWGRNMEHRSNRSSCIWDAANAPMPIAPAIEHANLSNVLAAVQINDAPLPKGRPARRAIVLRQAFCYYAPEDENHTLACSGIPLIQWSLFEFEGHNGWSRATSFCEPYHLNLVCARSALNQLCQEPEKLRPVQGPESIAGFSCDTALGETKSTPILVQTAQVAPTPTPAANNTTGASSDTMNIPTTGAHTSLASQLTLTEGVSTEKQLKAVVEQLGGKLHEVLRRVGQLEDEVAQLKNSTSSDG